MKRILVPNLIGAHCDAFIIAHKNGVFSKSDFAKYVSSRKTLMLNNSEIARLFQEMLRLGVFAGKNQRTFVVTDVRVTDWKKAIDNIKTNKGPKPGVERKKPEKRDYINVVTGYINSADTERLDHLQDLINQRRNVIKEEERLRSTYNGLLEYANCDNAEELIQLINKAKNL